VVPTSNQDGHQAKNWRAGLSDTILKGTHPGTFPARFGKIWFSGFRGEDLNVIFYQNMPNLHNRYKSAERKISETTGPIATKLWWNSPWMASFQICVRWSRLPTKMATKLKIEKRGDEILIVHCCFSISQNELKKYQSI
jgi:hypothetical protein